MSDRKRKSTSTTGAPPSKKQQFAGHIQVKHIDGSDVAKPIVASSPGLVLPDIKFHGFTRSHKNGKTNLLLSSNEHPTISHTAREDDISTENHLKHYIAVFDPERGRLEVIEAKRLTVRSAIKTALSLQKEDQENETVPSSYSSRAALTDAFGTKKSKKAAQSAQENRVLAQGNEDVDDSMSAALFSNIAEDNDTSRENQTLEGLRNKPLPPANLDTNEIDQVYSYGVLVRPGPYATTLDAMPIEGWVARIKSKKDVNTRSRFTASRVGYLVQKMLKLPDGTDSKFKTAVQILRYIELLLDLHRYVARLPKRKPLAPIDKWPEDTMSSGTPMSLVRPIVNHFFPDRVPKEHAITLLRTTILALTLHIPLPNDSQKGMLVTEPTDISMDMAIEASEAKRLFRELGCKISPATDNELSLWGLQKPEKAKKDVDGASLPKPAFVRLKFPLDFPKISRGRAPGRR